MKSNVDLYLNAERTAVVLADDPEARSLLVNAGREIPDAEVEAMGEGLLEKAQAAAKAAPAPETPPPAEAESKEVEQTEVEDKGRRRG